MERYYKCAEDSPVGKKIDAFWRKAISAAVKADSYAKRMGAVSYIQPAQYFEGGVDYLEFDKDPDLEVWRKKVLGDNVVYEPNCQVQTCVMILPDGETIPADTWDRTYNRKPHFWGEIRHKYPLKYWAVIVGYTLTGENNRDWDVIDRQLGNKVFVSYMEFSGDQKPRRGKVPSSLRKAVKAEKLRMALPVVTTEEFFSILSFHVPKGKKEAAKLSRSLVTPVFFKHDSYFYIESQSECKAEGLEEIDNVLFDTKRKKALIAAGLEEAEEDW